LADFGLSRKHVSGSLKVKDDIITITYRPPEILSGIERIEIPIGRTDVWLIGISIYEALGYNLFSQVVSLNTWPDNKLDLQEYI